MTDRIDPWEIDDWIAFHGERAGFLEYDCGDTRAKADLRAYAETVKEYRLQTGETKAQAAKALGILKGK